MVRASVAILVLLAAGLAGFAQEASEEPRGWLGIFLDNERAEEIEDETLRPTVVVRGIVEDGPAADAGLRARDRIVAVDGQPVTRVDELIARIGSTAPGTWLPLTVQRGSRERDIRVRLGTRPGRTQGLRVRRGWIGVDAIDLPPALRTHFGASEESGVMLSDVVAGSPAESAGLSVGDVVYAVDGEPVPGVGALARLLSGAGVGNVIEIALMRDGTEIVVEATVETEPPRNEPAER